MPRKAAMFAALLMVVSPTAAFAQNTRSPDSIAATAIESLIAGKNMEAVSGFLSGEKFGSGEAQLAYLAEQVTAANKAYGPIRSCEMVERKALGTMAERRVYLCQHTSYVTRWTMLFARTGIGWRGVNLSFDDKLPDAFAGQPIETQ